MKRGVARVSGEGQTPAMQLAALKSAHCKTVFKDEVTGAHVNRLALAYCPKTMQIGDRLIVWKLDWRGCALSVQPPPRLAPDPSTTPCDGIRSP